MSFSSQGIDFVGKIGRTDSECIGFACCINICKNNVIGFAECFGKILHASGGKKH